VTKKSKAKGRLEPAAKQFDSVRGHSEGGKKDRRGNKKWRLVVKISSECAEG